MCLILNAFQCSITPFDLYAPRLADGHSRRVSTVSVLRHVFMSNLLERRCHSSFTPPTVMDSTLHVGIPKDMYALTIFTTHPVPVIHPEIIRDHIRHAKHLGSIADNIRILDWTSKFSVFD